MSIIASGIEAVERGLVPDLMTRLAIRQLCRKRLQTTQNSLLQSGGESNSELVQQIRTGAIAIATDQANQQHYELPAEFFQTVLGPQHKYSCCYFADDRTTLSEAEIAALEITCQRAELANGQEILELGCGWGSLSLWMAERFPGSRIVAVTNSTVQRQYIENEVRIRGLDNLSVVLSDMNHFDPSGMQFDRVVSVEMFEHMRNYELLLHRIASWLKPAGKLFVHVFCHRTLSYAFETEGTDNWMGRYFFTGGIMPSADLLPQFNRDLTVTRQYAWNGQHYQRTAEAWLSNLDARRAEVLPILSKAYGSEQARRWLNRWRMFFLAVVELFGYDNGEQWYVSHYLLEHTSRATRDSISV
ncbi:MAG: cyclopropane-fatty-acyl-phospholipid synthase family protein [Planctomycetota bacterium]|nr:cyclopropane-fatty-acyl-phospholipid synthase family protein [Planctomycetota bacterium]